MMDYVILVGSNGGGGRLIGGIMGMEEAISNRLMTPRAIEDLSSQLLPNTGTAVWGSLLYLMLIGAIYEGHRGMGLFTRNALGYCSL